MKKVFLALAVLSLLLASSACKKGKAEFILSGQLTDATFNEGFSGLTVSLYEVEAGTTTETLIGTTTTTSDGSYSFTFPRNQAEAYILRATKQNYFPVDEYISFSSLTIDEENVRNFSTTAKSWLRLVFTNTAPAAISDILRFTQQLGKTGCEECLTAGQHQLNGIVDTVIYVENDGNTTFSYYYELLSTPNSGFKSATSTVFDTTTISLSY